MRWLLAAALMMWALPANASSADKSCEVLSATLDFGEVSALLKAPVSTVGSLQLHCTPGTAYSIALEGTGVYQSANGLSYAIYKDAAGFQTFDERSPLTGKSGKGGVITVHLFGRILPGQKSLRGGRVHERLRVVISYP